MRNALFPLHTILFPGSTLPLQIFEQRYLKLVTQCSRESSGFVSVLINTGKEVGAQPTTCNVGCYVDITDWETLPNGLLGITIQARYRCHLYNPTVKDDGLLMAETRRITEPIDQPEKTPLPDAYHHLADTLEQLLQHPFASRYKNTINLKSAFDVCYRLCELLPINNEQKQHLLDTPSMQALLDQLDLQIQQLQQLQQLQGKA